jgi:membrane protease YdiL (CAAX protease family)
MVLGMPVLLKLLSVIGTLAMLWVGGGIVIHGLDEFGLGWLYRNVHDVAHGAAGLIPAGQALVEWLVGAVLAGALGLLLGLAFMLPLTLLMLATGLRRLNVDLNALLLLKLLLSGLTSGLVVALIEESFLRGAMYSAVTRESGALPAVISTSLLYAATHFFARFTILPADVGPGSGVDLVLGSLRAFAAPAQMADAYLCLTAVGVLLAWVRLQTGNIAAGIGLHAGWVTLILVTLRISERDEHAAAGWLLSEHDGFVGWLTLAWTLLAAIPVLRYYQRQNPQRAPAPASVAA